MGTSPKPPDPRQPDPLRPRKGRGFSGVKTFEFWTDCIGMPGGRAGAGAIVNAIRDASVNRAITYSTFAKHADLGPLRAADHAAMYRISAPDNWAISFHRSALPSGQRVYYLPGPRSSTSSSTARWTLTASWPCSRT